MAIPEFLKRKARYRLFRQRWNVAAIPRRVSAVAGLEGAAAQREALDAAVWMDELAGLYRADPFPATRPGGGPDRLILFEEFPGGPGKGAIGAALWDGARFRDTARAFSSPHHLSYPYVLRDEGREWFMPEHAEARELAIHSFDDRGQSLSWRTIVADLPLIDSTAIRHGGKYWLFATHLDGGENSDLHLYHAETLTGPWTAHRGNPVKRDNGNARPAGQPFAFDGGLFRPAQNCARYYGANIVINRIDELSEDAFRETPVAELRPPPGSRYPGGLHTLSHLGDLTLIDGARFESRLHPALDRLGRLLG